MASSKTYQVTKWVRTTIQPDEHGSTHREAIDRQRQFTKEEGAKDYTYIYTIEESS